MKNIMVDNWFMEDVIGDLRDKKMNNSKSYAELLMAIVLWDSVYYPENDYNWWNSFPSQAKDMLCPIDDKAQEGHDEARRLFYENRKIFEEDRDWLLWGNEYNFESEVVGVGALRYMMLSANKECDYLPCLKRQSFLMDYYSPEKARLGLARMKMQGYFDNVIEQYYDEMYKWISDFSNIKLEMPVLAKFIMSYTPENMTPVEYAFHLKNEGRVIRYRQYLSQVESALENQEWSKLRSLLRDSDCAIADIIELDKKNISHISANILPTPSVVLKYGRASINVSSIPSIKFDDVFKKVHLTFLKDLTKYAINDLRFG